MAIGPDVKKYLNLASDVMNINKNNVWISHDKEADVIYINFKKPSNPDDSELTDDNIIIRYEEGEVVGLTILHASKRKN
ncbi:MAG: DUF2283 domain-containing protein [Thermoplasmata archaeon]